MTTRDARSLSPDALEALRRRAVAAVESGASQIEVARLFGVSRKTVGMWMAAYQRDGEESFRPKRRGRRPGEQMALSPMRQAWVVRNIVDGPPDRLGMPHQLWTGQAIAELVNEEFRILLSPATISKYLERWGLVEQRRRMDQRRGVPTAPMPRRGLREVGVNEWIPNAEILWTAWTRPHAPAQPHRGPVASRQNLLSGFRNYFGDVNVLVALSNRGVVFLLARRGPFDGSQVVEFFERLMAQVGRGLNVIVSEWPFQYYGLLQPWPQRFTNRISIRFAV